jgi:hypothetical protein
MGNHIQTCQPTLKRDKLFPGNMLEGNLRVVATEDVQVYGVRVSVVGSQYHKYTSGSGKHRSTHITRVPFSVTTVTCFGGAENSKQEHTLRAGTHDFPFALILSPAALPSARLAIGSTVVACEWAVNGVVDVSGRFNEAGSVPFQVFSLVPYQRWIQPSPAQKSEEKELVCCCCCGKGHTAGKASMTRTLFASDRDAFEFECEIDNSRGEDKINGVNVALVAVAVPKVGYTHLRPWATAVSTTVHCPVEPGQRGVARGSLRLEANAVCTIQSSVLDVNYSCNFVLQADGCCITNPVIAIPIEVYHTVDNTGAAQVMQQLQMNIQPMDLSALQSRGQFEVPNLMSNANTPAWGQVAPPQAPAGWPPQGFPTGPQPNIATGIPLELQQQQQQYGAPSSAPAGYGQEHQQQQWGAPPPPPPHPGAGFPGFATYPEMNPYFVTGQQVGQNPSSPKM